MFGKKTNQESMPVEQANTQNINVTQRSFAIKKDLAEKRKELLGMDDAMRILQEKIENKRVLIASYKKSIVDHEKDYDRITSKHKIMLDDIHELEKEERLYNKGTHKDLLSTQELENLNFLEAVQQIKEFNNKEKEYVQTIKTLSEKIKDLEKGVKIEKPVESEPKKIEEPGFFKKLLSKKPEELKNAPQPDFKHAESENYEEPKKEEKLKKKKAEKKAPEPKKAKKTTKKSSKKLLKDKGANKVSKKGEK